MPYWQTQALFLHLMGSKNQVPRMGREAFLRSAVVGLEVFKLRSRCEP